MIDKLLQEGQLGESFSMLQAEETYSKLADYVDTMKNNADLAIKVLNHDVKITELQSNNQQCSICCILMTLGIFPV